MGTNDMERRTLKSLAGSAVAGEKIEPLLRSTEVCEILRVSKTTLWRRIRRGELAVIRAERRLLFEPEEVRRYIALRRCRARS